MGRTGENSIIDQDKLLEEIKMYETNIKDIEKDYLIISCNVTKKAVRSAIDECKKELDELKRKVI